MLVLNGRKLTPTMTALGWAASTCSKVMNSGHVPGPDYLVQFAKAENVSLSWLLYGEGSPYVVAWHPSDDSAADVFQQLLSDEPYWQGTLVVHGNRMAVVLDQEAVSEFRDNQYHYHAIEIHTGRLGSRSLDVLDAHGIGYVIKFNREQMDRLISGYMGTYELFTGPEPLARWGDESVRVVEDIGQYHVENDDLVRLIEDMEPAERTHLLQFLAARQGQ